MLKLVVFEISSPYDYSKVRNTSLRFLWPRTGPHTLLFLDRNNRPFAGLFGFKMRANKKFLLRLPNCFLMCLDSDKKILHLCSTHVIAMSSR